jgi:hypothetical protein
MQTFYEGWRIVRAFLEADAAVPREVYLPNPAHREVARILAEKRDFPVLEVIKAIEIFGQPELLKTSGGRWWRKSSKERPKPIWR